MAKAAKKLSPLGKSILRTAKDMLAGGIMDKRGFDRIAQELGATTLPNTQPITAKEIRALREKAEISQAVFAKCLNVTPDYVSKLERGAKRPTGSTLVLLNVIQRNGIELVL